MTIFMTIYVYTFLTSSLPFLPPTSSFSYPQPLPPSQFKPPRPPTPNLPNPLPPSSLSTYKCDTMSYLACLHGLEELNKSLVVRGNDLEQVLC